MAKNHTNKDEDRLREDVEVDAVIALVEAKNQLLWTQSQLIKHLTGKDNDSHTTPPQNQPPNYDSPDFDEQLNKQVDNLTLTKGIISQVYYGRYVSIQLRGDGAIEFRQQSHHRLQTNTETERNYTPTQATFSQETFFLILEAMEYAEKKFGLDRKAVIEKLTGGGEVNFKDGISLI